METLTQLQCLALHACKGLGVASILALQKKCALSSLFHLSDSALRSLGLNDELITQLGLINWPYLERIASFCEQTKISIISYFDGDYPRLLKEISSPPFILFCKGDVSLLSKPQVAIVGSRSATATGLEIAADFAYKLRMAGLVVTSGLARGIDGAAHKGALAAKDSLSGSTIAVLGTGVDIVYPKRHNLLYQQVLAAGLLVSEFFPGSGANASHFPRRNRIISGLSLGVVLVEAEMRSGSLITARYALEQNRDVFAVPGSIKSPLSQGCHYLLKQGAKLTESVEDILEDVSFLPENGLYSIESVTKNDSPQEDCPVLKNLGFEVTSVDTLTQRTQWPVERVVARLLDLELEDKVERVLDGYIKLARG
ncbi:DNA-processing protein DprA [Pseudoalteromonas byunsanensis]|uniref:DNA protecting protein DprA n=1 Tax=Pseudoalteromonas byunsanensis TaxID=327939 RepID=A0A1S1NC64_9GAMM|nr:DNA-processing protein DprA [Pseudoalteromonas byunsanensis]OHU96979.1 DNA protecting protein DprA [Pseudoalteromonas byunsanensis]